MRKPILACGLLLCMVGAHAQTTLKPATATMKSSTAMPRLQARAQSPRVTVPRQGAPTLKTEQSSALADSLKVSSQMRGQPGARQLSDKQVAAIFGLTVNGKQRGLRF